MNMFRLLKADETECRIAQVKAQGISLLIYKTARTDANLLDETVGFENWQNDFKIVDGVLYGGIGIFTDNGWVWKWDAGTESNTEAEKGRASDAFKRAGFKWGIGRELYTAPFIWIPSDKCKITESNGYQKCYEKFEVASIGYDENRDINELTIINSQTRVEVFKMGAKPKETYNGEKTITATQVKALKKSCDEDHIPTEYVCELYGVGGLPELTEAKMANIVSNWDKLKAKYNARANS